MINNVPATILDFPPDDESELIRQLPVLLCGKSVQEVAVLWRCYLDKQPDAVVAKEFGLSSETVRLNRAALKNAHDALHYLLQPPHAAD
jgi:hypothetical protein